MREAVWLGRALDDLADVDDFYAAVSPDHADRIGRAAVRAARFLAEHPHAGPVVDGPFRKWRVPGTNYVLVYRIEAECVEIMRVHHGHEDWRPRTP